MRSYAHTKAKHAKRDEACHSTPFRGLMQSHVSHINQPNMLTIPTSNTYPNTLGIMITTTLTSRNNITRMNKS